MKRILLKKIKIIFFIILAFSLFSCLKEMPEKGLKITIPENNPIDNLKSLLRNEEKTKILLFGVPSLTVLSSDFSPLLLERMIEQLSNFNPDVICLDAIPPKATEVIANEEFQIVSGLQKKLKLTNKSASEQLDSLLNSSKKNNIDFKTRKRLIELFICTYDFYSAALNLLYLTQTEINNLKLDNRIIEKLTTILKKNDEKTAFGIQLAYKLKMNRVYSINDISDKPMLDKISEQLYNEMLLSDVYNFHKKEFLNQTADNKLKDGLLKKDLYDFFSYINSDNYSITTVNNTWSVFYKMFLESGLERTRIGLWEMKNLRIASNIREVSSFYPSKKILIIIDVSKKPFVEEYLNKMTDLKILKLKEVIN